MGDIILIAWIAWLVAGRWVHIVKIPEQVLHIWRDSASFVQPLLAVAAATTLFYSWRRRDIANHYRKKAINRPKELIKTAGSILDEVVGRDELCSTLIEELHDENRRVHIIQGGIGSGKTAVMVELTKQLARRDAIPINIRLSDAQGNLDFSMLALKCFQQEVGTDSFSETESERAFRMLRRADRIVVLADGLEEALKDRAASTEGDHGRDRDNIIRLAIRRAEEERLPLVIATRPHDPLRAMNAAVVELEPLGEKPALDYLKRDAGPQDYKQLARMISSAEVSSAPLYLNLTRRLYHNAHPLWLELVGVSSGKHDPSAEQYADKAKLRLRILDAWRQAICDGYLYQDFALKQGQRETTLEVLSALACVGLLKDSPETRFSDLVGTETSDDKGNQSGATGMAAYQCQLIRTLAGQIKQNDNISNNDLDRNARRSWMKRLREAAIMGSELGIVEARRDSMRFNHSQLQAYLGSRYLPILLEEAERGDTTYWSKAMGDPTTAFLIALVLASRRGVSESRDALPKAGKPDLDQRPLPKTIDDRSLPLQLAGNADKLVRYDKSHALALYAAAFGVDSGKRFESQDHAKLAASVAQIWKDVQDETEDLLDRDLVDARTVLVTRMGDAARTIAARHVLPAAKSSWLGWMRWRVVSHKSPTTRATNQERRTEGTLRCEPGQTDKFYVSYYEIACCEKAFPQQIALAQQIGAGGDLAFAHLHQEFDRRWNRDHPQQFVASHPNGTPEHEARERVMCAWLAPLLYLSCESRQDDPSGQSGDNGPEENLQRWIDGLTTVDPSHPERQPNIQSEIALAQGFRYAANNRGEPQTRERVRHDDFCRRRNALIELAESTLAHARFWYSHLILIQALALLNLPDNPSTASPRVGHAADPGAMVTYWLDLAGSLSPTSVPGHDKHPHPLVREAADLAALALTSREPQHFVWIDESGVVGQVGSSGTPYGGASELQQWIQPSVGWAALHPRAQLLVAEVLLILNLADRGEDPEQRDERMRRAARSDLPPCLTQSRQYLDVSRTIGSVNQPQPGNNCADNCPFRLCPYPAIGEKTYQAEVSEGLCRQLAKHRPGRIGGRWQRWISRHELENFWTAMANRNLPPPPD
ncbi:hypothetical protein [Dactylosporangium sp. CA-092794]|uniref:hypothetical protein n=1 Tax=Dactylosporangium sp. CA-092794 TaxID=3239929 RepID=UPI003D9379A4